MGNEEKLTKKERRALKKQEKQQQQMEREKREGMNKLIRYGVLVLIILGVGYWLLNQRAPVPESELNKPVDQVLESDWVKGNVDAEIILIEYSDFQCPACRAYSGVLDDLVEKYGNDMAFVYRHFPLKQIHLQAELAAQAAEAAGKQGKFWEMHAKLFETQEDWAESSGAKNKFITMAEELGLDVNQFKKDIGSKEVRALVKADFLDGLSQRLNSTPSFYINGEKIANPPSPQSFDELIGSMLTATNSGELDTASDE